jgi:acyl-CoA dehydrogenase
VIFAMIRSISLSHSPSPLWRLFHQFQFRQNFSTISSFSSSSPDLNYFRETIRRWIRKDVLPNIGQWEQDGLIPREIYKQAANIGLFSSGYPLEFGGLGDSPNDFTIKEIVVEELCQVGSGGFIASLCTHSISLSPIVNYGTPRIQNEIIPSVLSGDAVCALCVTEPSGGSDVANLQTTATLQSDGSYLLNGIKTFITSGVQADYYTVAARTSPHTSSYSNSSSHGISLFAISSTLPGITKVPLKKMGWHCSDTATIYFDNVVIPADSLLGKPHSGFPLLMKNFNSERIFLSLQSFHFSRLLYRNLIDYAKQRKVFQKTLISNQVIQHQLIDLHTQLYSNEVMIKDVLRLYAEYSEESERSGSSGKQVQTLGKRDPVQQKESLKELIVKIAILKNVTTDTFHFTADRAVQIMGGAGYMREDSNVIERLYRETKVMQIGGGSTEIMKELIGKYLGFQN